MLKALLTMSLIASLIPLQAKGNLDYLAEAIYYEARSESPQGQLAVAQVILNRVRSSKFPSSIKEVVYQKRRGICQFSYYCLEKSLTMPNKKAKIHSYSLAKRFLEGGIEVTGVEDSDHYFNSSLVSPSWASKMSFRVEVGSHTFLREYR